MSKLAKIYDEFMKSKAILDWNKYIQQIDKIMQYDLVNEKPNSHEIQVNFSRIMCHRNMVINNHIRYEYYKNDIFYYYNNIKSIVGPVIPLAIDELHNLKGNIIDNTDMLIKQVGLLYSELLSIDMSETELSEKEQWFQAIINSVIFIVSTQENIFNHFITIQNRGNKND